MSRVYGKGQPFTPPREGDSFQPEILVPILGASCVLLLERPTNDADFLLSPLTLKTLLDSLIDPESPNLDTGPDSRAYSM